MASHRRSGTHALMNLVHNHFGKQDTPLRIQKIGHLAADEFLSCPCLEAMFAEGPILYTERSFDSVLLSMYYYLLKIPKIEKVYSGLSKNTTLAEFLQMDEVILDIAWQWKHTSESWAAVREQRPNSVIDVRFEDVVRASNKTLDRLAVALGRERNKTPFQRKQGVLVGIGKGTAEPPLEVVVKAEWAIANTPNETRYLLGARVVGRPLDSCACAMIGANLSNCPKIWNNEVISA